MTCLLEPQPPGPYQRYERWVGGSEMDEGTGGWSGFCGGRGLNGNGSCGFSCPVFIGGTVWVATHLISCFRCFILNDPQIHFTASPAPSLRAWEHLLISIDKSRNYRHTRIRLRHCNTTVITSVSLQSLPPNSKSLLPTVRNKIIGLIWGGSILVHESVL